MEEINRPSGMELFPISLELFPISLELFPSSLELFPISMDLFPIRCAKLLNEIGSYVLLGLLNYLMKLGAISY